MLGCEAEHPSGPFQAGTRTAGGSQEMSGEGGVRNLEHLRGWRFPFEGGVASRGDASGIYTLGGGLKWHSRPPRPLLAIGGGGAGLPPVARPEGGARAHYPRYFLWAERTLHHGRWWGTWRLTPPAGGKPACKKKKKKKKVVTLGMRGFKGQWMGFRF